jgi:hypothetical protein
MSDCSVESAFLGDPNAGLVERAARGAGHRPHIEVPDSNRVEPARKISGGFFDPVASPVGVARFEFGDRELGAPCRLEPRSARARRCWSRRSRIR